MYTLKKIQSGLKSEAKPIYKKSLFIKLLVWMLLVTTIPFILSNIISYRSSYRSLQNQVIELNRGTLLIGMENMKKYLQELNLMSVSWYSGEDMAALSRKNTDVYERYTFIQRNLSDLYSRRHEIKIVNFYSADAEQQYESDDSISYDALGDVLPPADMRQWDRLPGYEVRQLGGERLLAVHKKLIDYPKSTLLGLLSIYVSLDEVESLNQLLFDRSLETMFMYINTDNQLLYTSSASLPSPKWMGENVIATDNDTAKQGYWFGEWEGKQGVYVYASDHYLDLPLTIIKFIPSTVMNESAKQTLSRSIAIQLVALVCIVILAFVLSYSTIVPIKRLVRSISYVELGIFDIAPTVSREDELGILERRFELMVHNLKRLIVNEYQQKLEISTARLKMLQAQINPHFLYNALQSISTEAMRHQAEEVSDRITELGFILRYSMDMSKETVPLEQELDHIGHYLSLQENRFRKKLTYQISCDPAALSAIVPKMILQPIVENSIIHGIENGTGKGRIEVDIKRDSRLVISISDNGKGMKHEEIEAMKARYAKHKVLEQDEGGIGLMNVLQRLWLQFGDDFHWEMTSLPYEKTQIRLMIHFKEEEA
ncbi:sensor histidine kinase [Paenibacillus sp. URB8-2]|uniref:sensor histidine kinase n=1 Tax=Paenibacillus sp. URB8-2 TaxID=2741301 RepID=UPI0015B7F600|nr:sensor histidine kinase [Paenibacillus sp. URB8-2]BCG57892.1 sensor histidine kinase YesM [Paenibacillus sp. URB8-2]